MDTKCKFAKMALNFDMSGMVMPCNLTNYYLKDDKDRHYNVLTDDVKDIWHSAHRKKLIDDHENGVRNPTCKLCWDYEEAGVKSPRQKFNEELEGLEYEETQPRVMVVKPGNKCNNACRSCNPHTSSMWYKTDYALNDQGKTFKEYLEFFKRHKTAYDNNEMLEQRFAEWEDKVALWNMYGGEPMIIPLFYKILEQSLKSHNVAEKVFDVHTNGMTYKEDIIEKFSRFKSAHIGFSIDAIGKKNDYIRYGSKWDDIISNLKNYMADCAKYDNVSMTVRATITPWSIYHCDEMHDFFHKLGIEAIGVWCDDKPWNDVRYLPRKVKDAIIEKLSKYSSIDPSWLKQFEKVKKWMPTEPDDYEQSKNAFMDFNKKIDSIRKEKFQDVFPEYSKLF